MTMLGSAMSTSSRGHAERVSTQATDSVAEYLREIRSYPLLSREEEAELGRRIRAGDGEALHRLVCSNLRFVVSVAKRYQHRGVPLADLIDDGNLALLHAARRFDAGKGAKFISYAVWWVRQAIAQSLADQGQAVRVPLNWSGAQRRIRRAVSLDAPIRDREDTTLLEVLPDEAGASPDQVATIDNLADSVATALAQLPAREADVLRLYFGFGGEEPLTLERIGHKFGVTRERVRQIKDRALWRIRCSSAATALASLQR